MKKITSMEEVRFFGLKITEEHANATADEIKAAQFEVFDFLRPKPIPYELTRLGGDRDGAYLVPTDSLETLEACISPGVKNRKAFEDELTQKYRVASHMCDKSSNEADFATPLIPGLQTFRKVWLDTIDKPDAITLKTWIESDTPGGGDLLLQMDIEGAEYRILLDVPEDILRRFRFMVLELHKLDHINDPGVLFQVLLPLARKLGRHFVSVHAHPNNVRPEFEFSQWDLKCPRLLEITLLRKDRIPAEFKGYSPVSLPHPLDILKNVRPKPPIFLQDAWRTGDLRPKNVEIKTESNKSFVSDAPKGSDIEEMQKYVIHLGTGGLGHMFRLLGNTIDYCKKNKKTCMPLLENDLAFSISFYSIFEAQDEYIAKFSDYKNIIEKFYIYEGEKIYLKNIKCRFEKTNGKPYYKAYHNGKLIPKLSLEIDAVNNEFPVKITIGKYSRKKSWQSISALKAIKINRKIANEIVTNKEKIPFKFIGVHYRNTDKPNDFLSICAELKKIIEATCIKDVYLATDDSGSLNQFKDKFPYVNIHNFCSIVDVKQLGFRNMHRIPSKALNDQGLTKEIQITDALKDIFMLSASDFFIPTPHSSLSYLVQIFREDRALFSNFYNMDSNPVSKQSIKPTNTISLKQDSMISTILHMGLPKTGSTSMQGFFFRNRALLQENGILYPTSLGEKAHVKLLALAGHSEYRKFDPVYSPKNLKEIQKTTISEIRRELESIDPRRVILSCENMPRGTVSNFLQLRKALESCGLRIDKVLLYLRPQAEWRRSIIQQRIKVGMWSDENQYPVDDPEMCGTYGCYRDHVERRAAAFGMETIKPRLFGHEYFKDGDFYRDLLEAFELPELEYELAQPSNESLSDFACRMLMHLNKSLPRYKSNGSECPRRLYIRRVAAKHFTAIGDGALGKSPLRYEVIQKYEKYYEESNEWIRERFFPERTRLFNFETPFTDIQSSIELASRAKDAANRILELKGNQKVGRYLAELHDEISKLPDLCSSGLNAPPVSVSLLKEQSKSKSDYQSMDYWNRRNGMIYYRYIEKIIGELAANAQSMIDVGSGNCPYLDWFDWIPERVSVDIRVPYKSEHVTGIKGDIFKLEFPKTFDICTCFQVLEHVPNAAAFAKRLLQLADIVVISIPYKWPNKPKPIPSTHIHDPVDYAKLTRWIGRDADYKVVVKEPSTNSPRSRRLIAVYCSSAKPISGLSELINSALNSDKQNLQNGSLIHELEAVHSALASTLEEKAAIPPEDIPAPLLGCYTLNGTIPVKYHYFNNTKSEPRRLTLEKYTKVLNALAVGTFQYYGNTLGHILSAIKDFPLMGKNVCVFGALNVNCDAIALFSGAKKVSILEYNVPVTEHPKVECLSLREALQKGLQWDVALSISSFEHDGLGRYGDPLNPDGDLRAMGEARQMIKPDGLLYLAVPVGPDCVVWNAHRVYGKKRLPMLLDSWQVVKTYGYSQKLHELPVGKLSQPVFVLKKAE